MTIPTTVEVTEVGPRDGLQAEPEFVATNQKIQLINGLIDAGCLGLNFRRLFLPVQFPN